MTQSGFYKKEVIANNSMVATKDRLASEAAIEVLKSGGNAIDAAIVAFFVLSVVEPYSSGIGGGGYLVYQFGEKGGVIGFPMKSSFAATENMFTLTGEKGVGMFGWDGTVNNANLEGILSIGIPGSVAGLCKAHSLLGKIPLKELIQPAIKIARQGFIPGWFTLNAIAKTIPFILRYEGLSKIFIQENNLEIPTPEKPYCFKQPELANSLELIANEGSSSFYHGELKESILKFFKQTGSIITEKDFTEYSPFIWNKGLEFEYKDSLIRVPPFASGGITTAMTLNLLNEINLKEMQHNTPEMLHNYISSARLAYADRFTYIADPKFVDVPWEGLLSIKYAKERSGLISDENNKKQFLAGQPWNYQKIQNKSLLLPSNPSFDQGTTHLNVIDNEGNAISLTNTIGSSFGSGIVPENTGIIMNNGMLWFDPVPGHVNSITGGKYPLNNMSPALIFTKTGDTLAVGASGGRRITNCVSNLIINLLDFNMTPQQAIDSPRVDCSLPYTSLDHRISKETIKKLKHKGHQLKNMGELSKEQTFSAFASPVVIQKKSNGTLYGGADTFHSAFVSGN